MNENEDIGKLFKFSIVQENVLTELRTLAIEYQEKQITAERFSKRVIQVLCAGEISVRNINKPAKEEAA